MARGTGVTSDPLRLLRLTGPVDGYPLEPSDAELAEVAGVPVEAIVRYDMNTLGGGALPAVVEACSAWDPSRAVEYGDLGYRDLRRAIGSVTGVDPRQVVPGAGADELIRLVTGAVVGPGDSVVVPTPTFPMFAVEARLAGSGVVDVPRSHPSERQPPGEIRAAVERSGAKLVWLCSPNNPTGDPVPLDEVATVADGLEAIVVVDQVYLEFAEASGARDLDAVALQERHPNVLVLRSLAKAYGLAGARIGYLVVPEPLAERFDALRLPLSVGLPTEVLARAALRDADEARRRHVAIMAEQRRLAGTLRELGCEVLDGLGNFVTFRPRDAPALAGGLLRRGLVVRAYESGPMTGWLRATARATEENDRLIGALAELLAA